MVFTFESINDLGCINIATLYLTISAPSSSFTDAVACDSYEWNGITYTESGTYTFNTINQFGCDSIATLNLTINNSTVSQESVSACDSYDWNGEVIY